MGCGFENSQTLQELFRGVMGGRTRERERPCVPEGYSNMKYQVTCKLTIIVEMGCHFDVQLEPFSSLLSYVPLFRLPPPPPTRPQECDPTPDSFTQLRLHLASSLYYKLLHGIVQDEVEEKKCSISTLQSMLEHELFHKSLFALCVEIVLFSYNSQSRFV